MEQPVRPKRSLGQNFLINPGIIDKIIAFSGLKDGDTVLEIGPGKGAMTKKLALIAGKVVAVEKDDELSGFLKGHFSDNPNISVINDDILNVSMKAIVPYNALLIANLPYNIATVIISNLLEIPHHFASITIMVQKEVGERICARPGTKAYSAMSVLVASCFETDPGFIVGPGNFSPAPKVDSMVMKLVPRPDAVNFQEIATLRRVVFSAFKARRKMLRNSLLNIPGMTDQSIVTLESSSGIVFSRRPQELSIDEFLILARLLEENRGR
jgi:16S rRNA (adenine1518-N6/adenine1519-N6)-dimethyltransferase